MTNRTNTTQEFYGQWATLYDVIARCTPGVARVRRQAVAALRLGPGDTAVEMGCGTGANLPYLAEAVGPSGTVLGIDVTGPVLEHARVSTAAYPNVHVVRADATNPPLADADADRDTDDAVEIEAADVDAVLATFVVGMLEHPARAVDDWCDLVGSGGHVVLVNASRSRAWYAPIVNRIFSGVVVLSTPPTRKLRYEQPLDRRLDERVRAAHDRLRNRSSAVAETSALFDVVRLTGGRVARDG